MDKYNFLNNIDIDNLYADYKKDPNSVEESWRMFFSGFEFANNSYKKSGNGDVMIDREFKVINLIEAYRKRGHLFTKTNPVRTRRKYRPTLDIKNYDLTDADLEDYFMAGNNIGLGKSKLKDIIDRLTKIYCRSIGCEYMFIREPEVIKWLQNNLELNSNTPNFNPKEKRAIYSDLKKAVGFENFIHRKFTGQKRFSLEGAEGMIPALNAIVQYGAEFGASEFIIGMAHRGRLNVLANVLGKPFNKIFSEFLGEEYDNTVSLGDVKYHLGYGNKIVTPKGNSVEINLAPNPSHLETVGPVVEGIARGKIDNKYSGNYKSVIPIVVHGDAAIAAQGVVYETLQMSQLEGYKTGGTIHIVINNQVGFTTNYLEGRSSTYSTDIAKVTKAPIFHVNGDDVEALVHAVNLAVKYRQKFHHDVFIDLLCYRKYGHNEGDEPRFTQPTLYKAISKHPNIRDIYSKKLVEGGVINSNDISEKEKAFNTKLESELEKAKQSKRLHIKQFLEDDWQGFKHPKPDNFFEEVDTTISKEQFYDITEKMSFIPDDLNVFKKARKLHADRLKMLKDGKTDWAMGELLSYSTLLLEKHRVRVSGQDSERGTFSHRHATLTIEDTTDKYTPLKHLSEDQGKFNVINSLLSEYAVMAFEYGYALTSPESLVIWEAQFGDFHNVAQVVIDQYISSAEDKWGLMNGITLLLPHGYEGQGPEHSSARIERFLTLCANYNIQVLNCTTPANLFHAHRRQLKRTFRVPQVIFTPKSLLRHPKCISTVEEYTDKGFQEIIDDKDNDKDSVTRVVFCTGKIYYDLLEKKQELNVKDIAIVRIEQLYPFPIDQFRKVLEGYPNAIKWIWAQEEPENMGAWQFIRNTLDKIELQPVTRIASGSPAVGLNKLHLIEQQNIIDKIFRKCDCELNNIYCGLQCEKGSSKPEIKRQYKYIYSLKNPDKH